MIKDIRKRRKFKIRKKITGTASIPRVSIYRSLKSIYVQAIDDINSHTLCSASVMRKKNQVASKELAEKLAGKLKEKNIEQAKFDRNGYKFAGVLRVFVEELRKNLIKI